ncbi:mucin-2-like [Liolophura sinensis]|uniref:mucin-2-like n=1 Tax=Liolophura sinensis TaxID=3198878 RepID=UPI0031591FA1
MLVATMIVRRCCVRGLLLSVVCGLIVLLQTEAHTRPEVPTNGNQVSSRRADLLLKLWRQRLQRSDTTTSSSPTPTSDSGQITTYGDPGSHFAETTVLPSSDDPVQSITSNTTNQESKTSNESETSHKANDTNSTYINEMLKAVPSELNQSFVGSSGKSLLYALTSNLTQNQIPWDGASNVGLSDNSTFLNQSKGNDTENFWETSEFSASVESVINNITTNLTDWLDKDNRVTHGEHRSNITCVNSSEGASDNLLDSTQSSTTKDQVSDFSDIVILSDFSPNVTTENQVSNMGQNFTKEGTLEENGPQNVTSYMKDELLQENDTLASNKDTTSDVPTSDKYTASGVSTPDKYTSSDVPTSDKYTSSDVPTSDKYTPSDVPTSDKYTPSDVSISDRYTPSDVSTSDKYTPSDVPTSDKYTPSDVPTLDKYTPSDVSTSEKYTSSDVPTSEKYTPSNVSISDKYTPSDVSTSEKYTSSDVPTSEKYTPSDVPTLDKYTPSDVSTSEKYTSSNVSTSEKYTPSDVPTSDKYTPSDVPTSEKYTPSDVPTLDKYTPSDVSTSEKYTSSDVPTSDIKSSVKHVPSEPNPLLTNCQPEANHEAPISQSQSPTIPNEHTTINSKEEILTSLPTSSKEAKFTHTSTALTQLTSQEATPVAVTTTPKQTTSGYMYRTTEFDPLTNRGGPFLRKPNAFDFLMMGQIATAQRNEKQREFRESNYEASAQICGLLNKKFCRLSIGGRCC